MLGLVILLVVALIFYMKRVNRQRALIRKLKYEVFCKTMEFYRVSNELNRIKNPLPIIHKCKNLKFIGFEKIAINFWIK
ncbi:hypothetical protein KARL1_63 [Acinetobacter phage KARL-1]|uniref:Uncharacterized protein n=2 Tax=Lazarusvirus TaxID=2842820 RepID=A0A385IIH3_9CAUD|nr:hypothetical protein HYP70_gp063 [Acinetobacter phage KARL-1]AXY82682.1 hypothetical protein KARL1_63 [Acinetobacter phage KARL-1]